MKTCRDCVHYVECLENYDTYHVSILTPDSDVTDRCMSFEDKTQSSQGSCILQRL